jgi:hypothetical protein
MPNLITIEKIQALIAEVETGDITAAYDYLSTQGYQYASWANGVAKGNTIAGAFALDFLQGTALVGIGRMLSPETIQAIKKGMALEYLNVLAVYAKSTGFTKEDINARDVWQIHKDVFIANGQSIENWTLDAPFRILEKKFGAENLDLFWNAIRGTGGTYLDAMGCNFDVLIFMYVESFSSDPEICILADTWMKNVPVFSALYTDTEWITAWNNTKHWGEAFHLTDILSDFAGSK